jgi:biopolymer transport protein ExbD
MGKKKKKAPGINATSSADIAFMLLLFFLLTTSMDTDQGLARRLPPPPENKEDLDEQKIKKRNTLKVLVSYDNRVMCNGEEITLPDLRLKAKEFIQNEHDSPELPEKEEEDIPYFGKMMITKKHIISLQCDRATKYQTYIDVQNELAAAYNELRNALAESKFNKKFTELEDDQRMAIQKIYSQKISEAEPKQYGDNK